MINNNGASNVEERDMLIQQALASEEGRAALAQSMANPIQTSLLYQSLCRKIVMPDPLPQGALARYEKDVDVPAYVISKRGEVPTAIIEGDDFMVPTFNIATNPQVHLDQVKQRMFNIIDRVQVKAKNEISIQEDTYLFKLINNSVPNSLVDASYNHVINSLAAGQLQVDDLNSAFAKIEQHRLVVASIIMSPNRYADVRNWGKDVYDFVTQREVLLTGVFARIWTANILVSSIMPDNIVLVTAPAEYVGVMPIRQEITVIPADMPKRLRLGWVIYENVGFAVTNPKGIAKIIIT